MRFLASASKLQPLRQGQCDIWESTAYNAPLSPSGISDHTEKKGGRVDPELADLPAHSGLPEDRGYRFLNSHAGTVSAGSEDRLVWLRKSPDCVRGSPASHKRSTR